MDELTLEQDASELLVRIGQRVELWILHHAQARASSQMEFNTEAARIDAPAIRASLKEFLNHGVVTLEELGDGDNGASRRAG